MQIRRTSKLSDRRDKSMATKNTKSAKQNRPRRFAGARGYAVGGDCRNGIEWLACWLLDNVEGEIITEEQLRPWAVKAWRAHLKRHNAV